ncbi:MAG: outer membrane beta-barrel protein [bacterium]
MKRFMYAVTGSMLISITAMANPTDDLDAGFKAGWQAGPTIGYTCLGNTMSGNITYGVQGAYQLTEYPVKIELAYDRLTDSGTFLDKTGITGSDELDVNAFTVTGLWRSPLGTALTGNVGGGVGCYMSNFREGFEQGFEWERTGTKFGYHLDCGADYAVAENIELFAGLRYAIISYDAKTTVNTTQAQGQIGTLTSRDVTSSWNHFTLRIGASYKF